MPSSNSCPIFSTVGFKKSASAIIILLTLQVNDVKSETNRRLPETFNNFFLHNGVLRMVDYNGDRIPDRVEWAKMKDKYYWFIFNPARKRYDNHEFGSEGDIPIMGDFNGDRVYDFAVFQPRLGNFLFQNRSRKAFVRWGTEGDVPMNGDYTGDGVSDFVVWRPTEAKFYVKDAVKGSVSSVEWGTPKSIPISGDFNFDGITDYVTWNPENFAWNVNINNKHGDVMKVFFGRHGDIPVSGDFTGDGYFDYVVYRPAEDQWHIQDGRTGRERIVIAKHKRFLA